MNRQSFLSLVWVAGVSSMSLTGCMLDAAPKTDADARPSRSIMLSETERSLALDLAGRAEKEQIPQPMVRNAKITKEIVTAVAPYPATDETDNRRLVAVTSFDYRTGQAARVIVDLRDQTIVQRKMLPGSSAPVAPEEEARAKELLREDSAAYRELFKAPEDSYDLAFFISVSEEEGDLFGHRVLLVRPVYFRSGPEAPIAIVDLTADQVLRYED